MLERKIGIRRHGCAHPVAAPIAALVAAIVYESLTGPALELRFSCLEHSTLLRLASSQLACNALAGGRLSLLVRIEFPHFFTLVLEHLVELLSARLSVLVILVDQDRSDNELVEALQVSRASVLLALFAISLFVVIVLVLGRTILLRVILFVVVTMLDIGRG